MDRENFHLELLNRLNNELKNIIAKKEQYSLSTYNSILAGIIIRMNVLIEQCMMDFHSGKFDEIVKLIYKTRQKIVHYEDYTNLQDLEPVASDIVKKLDKVYESENKFFSKVFKYETRKQRNVVIPRSKNIVYNPDNYSYEFSSDNATIAVNADKVIKVRDEKDHKDLAYIISCESDMNGFSKYGSEMVYQKLTAPTELQRFFIKNFDVVGVDYSQHLHLMNALLDTFYKRGNYGTVYVVPKNNPKNRKKIGKVLKAYFNKKVIYKSLLKEVDFTTIETPSDAFINYKQVKNLCSKDLEKSMSKYDYFFIYKTISAFNNLNQKLTENKNLSEKERDLLKLSLLIGWSGNMVRNMRSEFVNSNAEFQKLYDQLVSYRTFFAHNPMQFKSEIYKRALTEFYELAQGYVSILNSLEVGYFTKQDRNFVKFIAMERPNERFVTKCHDQYVEVDPTTYIGDRLYYSSKGCNSKMRIALIDPTTTSYFERKNDDFFTKKFNDSKLKVSRLEYDNIERVEMDVNLDDLLYLFCAFKGKAEDVSVSEMECPSCKKLLLFSPSKRNNNEQHAAYLENIIQDYFGKKYLPYELVQEIKILKEYDQKGKLQFFIVDKQGQVIAKVIDKNELAQYQLVCDHKRFGHGR